MVAYVDAGSMYPTWNWLSCWIHLHHYTWRQYRH